MKELLLGNYDKKSLHVRKKLASNCALMDRVLIKYTHKLKSNE